MIGVIFLAASPDGMPGDRIDKHLLRDVSAKLQPNMLFGPLAPQLQSAVLPHVGDIEGRRNYLSFGLRGLCLALFSRVVSTTDPFSR
jgi:hypothetical protein